MLRLLVAAVALNGFAGERIVHLDEMDHLANRTALFNAGASVEEARYGVLMLHLATTNRVSYHKRFFPISVAPKEKDWTLSFRFRFDAKDAARELGLKLYFGDPKNPETRLLTMREEGSFFEGGAKPSAPQEGMAGFLYGYGESGYGAWNSAAITVSDGAATCWTMRGGKYVADGTGTFPAKPLVGWNLVATAEKTDFRFDRLMVTDGRAVPYLRARRPAGGDCGAAEGTAAGVGRRVRRADEVRRGHCRGLGARGPLGSFPCAVPPRDEDGEGGRVCV